MIRSSKFGTSSPAVEGIEKHSFRRARSSAPSLSHPNFCDIELHELSEYIKQNEKIEPFGRVVYSIMDRHELTPPQVYRNACMRRQDFSRAASAKSGESVSRQVVWQIIFGLKCSISEANELLSCVGFSRRKCKYDLILEYFLKKKIYDIPTINDVLKKYKLKQFSCYIE